MPVIMSGLGVVADLMAHSAVPFRGKPRYLRLVSTTALAADYGAAGFHVSVSRGMYGGCGSPSGDATANGNGGTQEGLCPLPQNRDDLGELWAQAAAAYYNAYQAVAAGTPLADIKALLSQANATADQAYAAEGIEPPSDPVLKAQGVFSSEPAMSGASPRSGGGAVMAAGGLIFGAVLAGLAALSRRRTA